MVFFSHVLIQGFQYCKWCFDEKIMHESVSPVQLDPNPSSETPRSTRAAAHGFRTKALPVARPASSLQTWAWGLSWVYESPFTPSRARIAIDHSLTVIQSSQKASPPMWDQILIFKRKVLKSLYKNSSKSIGHY